MRSLAKRGGFAGRRTRLAESLSLQVRRVLYVGPVDDADLEADGRAAQYIRLRFGATIPQNAKPRLLRDFAFRVASVEVRVPVQRERVMLRAIAQHQAETEEKGYRVVKHGEETFRFFATLTRTSAESRFAKAAPDVKLGSTGGGGAQAEKMAAAAVRAVDDLAATVAESQRQAADQAAQAHELFVKQHAAQEVLSQNLGEMAEAGRQAAQESMAAATRSEAVVAGQAEAAKEQVRAVDGLREVQEQSARDSAAAIEALTQALASVVTGVQTIRSDVRALRGQEASELVVEDLTAGHGERTVPEGSASQGGGSAETAALPPLPATRAGKHKARDGAAPSAKSPGQHKKAKDANVMDGSDDLWCAGPCDPLRCCGRGALPHRPALCPREGHSTACAHHLLSPCSADARRGSRVGHGVARGLDSQRCSGMRQLHEQRQKG